jgi:hypothetical protein
MRKTIAVTAFLALLAASNPSRADDDCWAPMADWQPREAVQHFAQNQGWTLRRIKIHDGCYRIYATDANGQDIKVTVNPVTLEILKSTGRDDDDHGHRRDADHHKTENGAD